MWKNAADIALRSTLLISIAAFDVAPAAAAIMPVANPAADMDGNTTPGLQDFAPLILAQSVGHDSGSRSDHSPSGHSSTEPETSISTTETRKIVLDLASIRRECGNYNEVYRIDCLRQGMEMLSASLPDNSDYRDVKRILRKASSKLGRIVQTYQDTAAPKLDVPANANPRFQRRRRYTAVRRAALPEAMAKARQVVEEASTELLRSSENSERRYAHYQQISAAVDSTKVLLRSS